MQHDNINVMLYTKRFKGVQHMSKKMEIVLKVLLILVIPAILLGYNIFEGSPLYRLLIGTLQIDKALKTKFLTQYGGHGKLILGREAGGEEFQSVWNLIKSNSEANLPEGEPYWISRLAIENGAAVTLPTGKKVVLIPESSPLFVFFCSNPIEKCPNDEVIQVGTIRDLRVWAQDKEKAVRFSFDLIVSLISIVVGLLIEFKLKNEIGNNA
jgi:hypothetical protein